MSNYTFEEDITPAQSSHLIIHEIVFTLFPILGICANAIIIYVIFKFNRIQTIENIFLANWAIADLCSLIVIHGAYRILTETTIIPFSSELICSIFNVGASLHATVIFFVIVVSIDWFINAYYEKASEKVKNFYKYIIGSIWVFTLLWSVVNTGYCISKTLPLLPFVTLHVSILAFFIITILLQCIRAVRKYLKKPKEKYTIKLTLTTALLGCWTFNALTGFVKDFRRWHLAIATIADCAIFGSSVVNLSLLYWLDNDFRACVLQTLKLSKKYKNLIDNSDKPIVKNRNEINVHNVLFHNLNEQHTDLL